MDGGECIGKRIGMGNTKMVSMRTSARIRGFIDGGSWKKC